MVVTQTAATTRAFAEQGEYDVDAGRDFLAVGAGSVVAGFASAFPVDASPPRTGAVASAGGRTQAGALGAAAVVVLLIPVANVLRDVPLSALAAILIFIALRLFHVRDLVAIAHFDLLEFALAALTLIAVVVIGVEQGIVLAVVLAILDRIRHGARPQLHVLGRVAGTTSWTPLSPGVRAEQQPGVLVVLFATPLWYANAVHFREEVEAALVRAGDARPGARHHRDERPRLHRLPVARPAPRPLCARPRHLRHGAGGRQRQGLAATGRAPGSHRRRPPLRHGGRCGHRHGHPPGGLTPGDAFPAGRISWVSIRPLTRVSFAPRLFMTISIG